MAGWGTGSFENEDAQSFLGRLKSLRIDDLRRILARAADQDGYILAPESSIAVAAAEVVAALVVSEMVWCRTRRRRKFWTGRVRTRPLTRWICSTSPAARWKGCEPTPN